MNNCKERRKATINYLKKGFKNAAQLNRKRKGNNLFFSFFFKN